MPHKGLAGSKRPSFCAALRALLAVDERDEDAGIVRRRNRLKDAIDDQGRVEPARVGSVQNIPRRHDRLVAARAEG
jgi:hypothetical protein